jgi:hypothetical protein
MNWFTPRRNPASRVVRAVDGRTWVVRRSIRWRHTEPPAAYEHDITEGVPIIVAAVVIFWGVVAYLWFGGKVHTPWYFWLIALFVAAVIAGRWAITRAWVITAECGDPVEKWEGVVLGRSAARAETRLMERALRTYGTPHRHDGPLAQTTSDATILSWRERPDTT